MGWSRQRRVVLLRRQLDRPLALVDHGDPGQPLLSFAEVGPDRQVWEYAALVTSLDSEILTLGQLYRDRADCENTFDELKNQWGWGGFTTHDLKRCRLLARQCGADLQLVEPVRAPGRSRSSSRGDHQPAVADAGHRAANPTCRADADHHQHARQGRRRGASMRAIAGFLAKLRQTAEQLNPVERWYRILSRAPSVKYLKGRARSSRLGRLLTAST